MTPPTTCPACAAPIEHTWKSETGQSDFMRFECGLELANQSGNPGWKARFNSRCKNFNNDPLVYSAVRWQAEVQAARQEVIDAVRSKQAYMAELTEWQSGNRSLIPTGIQRRDEKIHKLQAENAALRAEVEQAKSEHINRVKSWVDTIDKLRGDEAQAQFQLSDARAWAALWKRAAKEWREFGIKAFRGQEPIQQALRSLAESEKVKE